MGVYGNLIVIALAGFVSANPTLPVEKCELKDSKCMQKAFQDALPVFVAGIPETGIDVLDVMDLEHVAFDLAGLQFTLDEGKLKGMKNAVIDKVKWDSNKKKIEIKYHVDCVIKGKYTAGGRVLILPITGDGQFKLKMKNFSVTLVLDFETKKNPEGKDIVVLTKHTVDFQVKDNARFEMTNLFNGNKELSDAMLRFLNDNWKDVTQEFGRPLTEIAAKKLFNNVKKYLEANPIEDISIA